MNNAAGVTRAAVKVLSILAFFAVASGVSAQTEAAVPPPPEAPTTIFSTRLGDADVDLTLSGSWNAQISFGTGLLFTPGVPVQIVDSFPSLEMGPYFTQTPDLTASMVLLQRYFLDVSVSQDAARNSLVLGYRGQPPEVLRSLFFGIGGISIPASGFMEIPEQSQSSIGVSSLMASGASTQEFLLRWDSAQEKIKAFLGPNELLEETVELDGYIAGRFFFLPDADVDPQSLVLYIEDPLGTCRGSDGRSYRKAAIDDASLDAKAGLVSLKSVQKGRVVAYYAKNLVAIGDPALGRGALPGQGGARRDLSSPAVDFDFSLPVYLGQDMTHRRISMEGNDCLLLWEPGDSSPFQIDSSYAFTDDPPSDPSRIHIQLQAKAAGGIDPGTAGLYFQPIPDQKRFVVSAAEDVRADFRNFYPFPDPDGLIYGPSRDSLAGYLGYRIYVQLLSPAGAYILEPNLVPGSVRATVNGISETRFESDPVSGTVTFLMEIHPTDRVEIRYRVASPGLSGGDILFAWRDTIGFSDALKLSLAAGIRWNADPWSFSQSPYAKSGTVIAQAGLEGKGEDWAYSVTGGVAYTNPDTSGILRLFGMEGNLLSVDISEDNAYPAAPPGAPIPIGSFPPVLVGLSQDNRGYLYYKDFRSYYAGGAALNPISWSGFTSVAYADGGRMGPYNVSGSSAGSSTGQSLVFDFSLDASADPSWVGSQLLPVSGVGTDLSHVRAITLRFMTTGVSGSFEVFLQAGQVGEDLNGDGTIQGEASPTDPGFAFFDSSHAATLRAGGGPKGEGNGRLDSEDRNANGILDIEEPDRVVTIQIAAVSGDTAWNTFTCALSDSDRGKLVSTNQIRILIVAPAGSGTSQGQLVIDSICFEGASEFGAGTGGSVSVSEVEESLCANDPGPGNRLQDAYPAAISRFHPDNESQEVLQALWSGLASDLVITGYASQGTGGIQYDTIVCYLRLPAALPEGTTLSFLLEDPGGKGVRWNIDAGLLGVGPWQEIRAAKGGRTLVNGVDLGAPPPVFDPGYGSLSTLTLTVSGAVSGTLYIDEIACENPEGSWGASLTAEASYRFQGTILSIGDLPLLGNFSVSQNVALISPGFSSLYGTPYGSEDLFSRTRIGVDALFSRIAIDVLLRDFGGSLTASGSHRVAVPASDSPVTFTDSFSLNSRGEFSRENSLEIVPFSGFHAVVDARADATQTVLNQGWDARVSYSPVHALTLGSELELAQALSGFPLDPLWYGERWIRGMSLALPWPEGGDLSRSERLSLDLGLSPLPVGFQASFEAVAKSSDFTPFSRSQKNDLDASLLLLLHLAGEGDGLAMSLDYARHLTLLASPDAGQRFLQEAQSYGSLLSLQGYFLTNIPFVELFADNAGPIGSSWAGVSEGTYSPRATFTAQRSYGSHLEDLFLPSSADLTIGRDVKKDGELSSQEVFIRPKLSTHALNLFGRLGAYPLIPFVRTDEYGLSLEGTIGAKTGEEYRLTQAVFDVYISEEGISGDKVTLTQGLKWEMSEQPSQSLSDDVKIVYGWSTRPQGGIPLPLVPSDISSSAYLSHGESAALTVRWESADSFHPITLILGHETSLILQKHGSIKGGVELGFDVESLVSGFAYRLAFQAGIEAALSF